MQTKAYIYSFNINEIYDNSIIIILRLDNTLFVHERNALPLKE